MTAATRPAEAGRTRGSGHWGARVLQVLGGVLVLALAVAAVSVWWLDRSIERVDVGGLGVPPGGAGDDDVDGWDDVDPSSLTVLVLGSDSREDLTAEERRAFRAGDHEGTRTEVVSLVRFAPDEDTVRILNIPRDSRVERCDGSVGRINAAYEIGEARGMGGATCTVETVRALTGITIDHVVIVDFGGFVDIVDGLGGVTMQLDEPIQDPGSHLDLPAGCVELDGVDALAFARARQVDDDFGRIARQQRLVAELRAELEEVGVFEDLPQLLRVTEAIASAVELDSSLDIGTLQRLAREHRDTVRGDLEGRAVPGDIVTIGGASLLELDEQRLDELSTWLRTGTDPGQRVDDIDEGGTDPDGRVDDPDGEDVDRGRGEALADAREAGSAPRTLSGQVPAGLGGETGAEAC